MMKGVVDWIDAENKAKSSGFKPKVGGAIGGVWLLVCG